ncbi:hypothetical protein OUZ56_025150 [Daphnia magna]|uniref:Uncharacterized protein n=1 Tax=Daphnia magna TaxID=35525 RepID=A0ABQ9ZJ02_9CRUS|nr:hypothetical protein OUZ56_025150 [Daphnia magna]
MQLKYTRFIGHTYNEQLFCVLLAHKAVVLVTFHLYNSAFPARSLAKTFQDSVRARELLRINRCRACGPAAHTTSLKFETGRGAKRDASI